MSLQHKLNTVFGYATTPGQTYLWERVKQFFQYARAVVDGVTPCKDGMQLDPIHTTAFSTVYSVRGESTVAKSTSEPTNTVREAMIQFVVWSYYTPATIEPRLCRHNGQVLLLMSNMETSLHKAIGAEVEAGRLMEAQEVALQGVAQISLWLHMLRDALGPYGRFAHRDLHSNNVMGKAHPFGFHIKQRVFDARSGTTLAIEFSSYHEWCMVDFGFACLDFRDVHLTSGQSHYFSGRQECPPDSGLDLTILLYSLSRWLDLRSLNSISKRFGIPLKYYPLDPDWAYKHPQRIHPLDLLDECVGWMEELRKEEALKNAAAD